MVRHVAILGREFAIDLRTPALEEWFAQNWIFPEQALSPVPFVIALAELDGPPELRDGEMTHVALHRTSLECIAGDRCFTFGDVTAGVRLELDDHGSRVSVWGASNAASLNRIFAALRRCRRIDARERTAPAAWRRGRRSPWGDGARRPQWRRKEHDAVAGDAGWLGATCRGLRVA
jgi:hypothetical protein